MNENFFYALAIEISEEETKKKIAEMKRLRNAYGNVEFFNNRFYQIFDSWKDRILGIKQDNFPKKLIDKMVVLKAKKVEIFDKKKFRFEIEEVLS